MRRLWTKKNSVSTWICDVSPRAVIKLDKSKEESFSWLMEWSGDTRYEITNVYDIENKHTVDLERRSCTCREWDLTGIPCPHRLCAIYYKHNHPEHYVSQWYCKETY